MLKTRAEVRQEFARKGWSISAWAKQKRYSANLVTAILSDDETAPRYKCVRGDAHNIAIELGLKAGEISRRPEQLYAA